MSVLSYLFSWWNDATIGTRWHIFRRAQKVGTDRDGNAYFEERRPSLDGLRRRYVIYNGVAEASRISADWHGWMHHTFEDPPMETPMPRRHYERDHRPNMTGTLAAWHPKGSLATGGQRARSRSDYEAWSPDA